MKIKLLHAVLHDGHRVEAGQTGEIEEALAEKLIASGAAVAVEESKAAKTSGGDDLFKEPEPLIKPEADANAGTVKTTASEGAEKAAGTEAKTEAAPAAGTKTAEAEPAKKADKAKAEGK